MNTKHDQQQYRKHEVKHLVNDKWKGEEAQVLYILLFACPIGRERGWDFEWPVDNDETQLEVYS